MEALRDCLTAATGQLELARDRAHASIAPAIEARMRSWLPRLTSGRFLDVTVDPGDLNDRVSEEGGAAREARVLSHGTMEQVFLVLRLALSQVLSSGQETVPLVFDDVTVQSDAVRTMAILEMPHVLSREHQVIVFSQEELVADWARSHLTSDADQFLKITRPGAPTR